MNRILDDLVAACKPRYMEVVGDFNIRGGVKSVIVARHGTRIDDASTAGARTLLGKARP